MIGQVRRFNRTVTQRIGALNDAFLSRGRPLGQARLLWEIGPDGSDVRRLRARLDLDSGYLSPAAARPGHGRADHGDPERGRWAGPDGHTDQRWAGRAGGTGPAVR